MVLRALAYGLGFYGVGASWVFVSIRQFGDASLPLAVLLTTIFVSFLALIFTLPFLLSAYSQRFKVNSWFLHCLLMCLLWLLGEWSRSWLLTGFPWLFLGYAHVDTAVSGFAPLLGVYGVSAVSLFISACLATLFRHIYKNSQHSEQIHWQKYLQTLAKPLSLIIFTLVAGMLLQKISWSRAALDSTISVAMVQGNVPQQRKWDPEFLTETKERYEHLTAEHWGADLVIWPEAAIPLLYNQAIPYLNDIQEQVRITDTVFVTGILFDEWKNLRPQYFNSILAISPNEGASYQWFHKTRLVPFGEYVPLENWLRGLIAFFDLPTSIINIGPEGQDNLDLGFTRMALAICYEIAYPSLVAKRAQESGVVVTVSNDAWFGKSWGPLQHFQMAQMRAIETQRPVLRATNNGVTAAVDHNGNIISEAPRFQQASLQTDIMPRQGSTPYMIWRDWPLVSVSILILGVISLRRNQELS